MNITLAGGKVGDKFGAALAVTPDAINDLYVGAPGANAVFIFHATAMCGRTWSRTGSLSGSDTKSGDAFGSAIAFHDTFTLFIGAPLRASGAGGIYEFTRANTQAAWVQIAILAFPGTPANAALGGALTAGFNTLWSTAPGCLASVTCGKLALVAFTGASRTVWTSSTKDAVVTPCGNFIVSVASVAIAPSALVIVGQIGDSNSLWSFLGDEGSWTPTYYDASGGYALGISLTTGIVVVGDSTAGTARWYPFVPGLRGTKFWTQIGPAYLSKTSNAYPLPLAADNFGAAVVQSPTGGFTAVGATGRGAGAVYVYVATDTSATATPTRLAAAVTATSTVTRSVTPSRPPICGSKITFRMDAPSGIPQFQYFVVPSGVTWLSVFLWGAGGSSGGRSATNSGGGGAYVQGNLSVTPGETLRIIVGSGGDNYQAAYLMRQVGGTGGLGWNNAGGRSAIQRKYSAVDAAALTALYGPYEASARGLVGNFFTDIVTAAGGGGISSPGSGGIVGIAATSYQGEREPH